MPNALVPATYADYRDIARRRLPRQLFDYIDGGSYQEVTLRDNAAPAGRGTALAGVTSVAALDPSVLVPA